MTVLAVMTGIVGTLLVVMVLRRRREGRADKTTSEDGNEAPADFAADLVSLDGDFVASDRNVSSQDRDDDAAGSADSVAVRRRTIDDYAVPVGFDAQRSTDDEMDIGKICPACGARYASHHRVCQRCGDSELAALN